MVYHWTTKRNVKRILKEGLRVGSWICDKPESWHGEACLQIRNFNVDWKNAMYNWQATTGIWINPKYIKIISE